MGRAQAKSATNIQNDVAAQSLATSKAAAAQSAPWVSQAGNYWSGVASGNPAAVNAYTAPQIQGARANYDQARTQIERTLGKGGLRDSTLGNLETAQAGTLSQIRTGGINDALQRLASLGSGGQQLSIAGLGQAGQAGQSLASLSASKAQAVGAGIAGIGGAAGSILGGMASNPQSFSTRTTGSVYTPQSYGAPWVNQ